jgi:Nif-specific regulatory protein
MVAAGTFRADLYYRINVIAIQLPPLRDRTADIPQLAQRFLQKFNEENGRELSFAPDAIDNLSRCYFPGNVRELENCVRRAASLSQGAVVTSKTLACQSGVCLSATLWKARGHAHPAPLKPPASFVSPPPRPLEALKAAEPLPDGDGDDEAAPNLIEAQTLKAAMEKAGWVQAKAARLLGLTPRQIGYALRKHNISIERL